MATTTFQESVDRGGGVYVWSNADNWTAGVPDNNNLDAVIPAGKTCTYDADNSAFADGVKSLTVNGTLKADETAGTYYLKMKGNIVVGAAGNVKAGTSAAVPYPQTCTWTIYFNGAYGFSNFNTTGQLNLFCTEPTYRYVKLTADKAIGQTVLSVDTDVTGDIWAVGNTVNICDINKAQEFETYTIAAGGIAAGAITITPALTVAKSTGAYMVLCTRNIRIAGSTGSTTTVINALKVGNVYASVTGAGYGMTNCTTIDVGGVFWNLGRGNYSCSSLNLNSAVFTGLTYAQHTSSGLELTSCLLLGNAYGQYICSGLRNNSCLFAGNNHGQGISLGITNNSCTFSGNDDGQFTCSGLANNDCIFSANKAGLYLCSGLISNTCTFTANTYSLRGCVSLLNYNCLMVGGVECYEYSYLYRPSWAYIESIDHNQIENAYKAWCTGGIVSSQTDSPPIGYDRWYELAAEDTTQAEPVFRQYETVVQPGQTIEVAGLIRIADGEDLSTAGKTPRLQIIDKFADPLNDPANDPLDEDEPADCTGAETDWQQVDVLWANQGDAPRQVIVRMIAYTDGLAAVDIDTVWAVATYRDQIADIWAKLPAHYIMGSAVQTDKDDEIDAIKSDLAVCRSDVMEGLSDLQEAVGPTVNVTMEPSVEQ
jgi:hypothetical protein